MIWATDGSQSADLALEEALRLADAETRILAVHCDQRLYDWPALAAEDVLRAKIARRIDALRDAEVRIELVVRHTHREAADVVAELAEELGADAIVCGARGLGALAGSSLGSFTQRLLRIAPCPVVVVGPHVDAAGAREAEAATVL